MPQKQSTVANLQDLEDNFRILLSESSFQVARTFTYLESFSSALYEKIVERDDYIDNLKSTIENQCFSSLGRLSGSETDKIKVIRAQQIICVNLEKIADYCVNICKQVVFIHNRDFWSRFSFQPMCRMIEKSLSLITPALNNADIAKAMSICRAECELDDMFKENFDRIMAELRVGEQVDTCVTTLFIFRYLERMGDSLLNIGEAILLSILGEKIKIRQFEALQQTLSQSGFEIPPEQLEVNSFWGTRSGCNISRVGSDIRDHDSKKREQEGIFKSGNLRKILQEKNNIERWEDLMPGLVPRIYAFQESNSDASMLIEFISGPTLETIIISHSRQEVKESLSYLKKTLKEIWNKTLEHKPLAIDYMVQLQRRLGAIGEVHPEFFREQQELNGLTISSTTKLIEQCRLLEMGLKSPFTVFGHGDFNINNILFNKQKERIFFIDLYRSHRADYIEDIAVMMVSNFRLPVFDTELRGRLNMVIREIFLFARDFALKMEDRTFELRLALALARSFYTSTRFELNPKLAREMALRAIFLLEKIDCHYIYELDLESFSLPEKIFYYG